MRASGAIVCPGFYSHTDGTHHILCIPKNRPQTGDPRWTEGPGATRACIILHDTIIILTTEVTFLILLLNRSTPNFSTREPMYRLEVTLTWELVLVLHAMVGHPSLHTHHTCDRPGAVLGCHNVFAGLFHSHEFVQSDVFGKSDQGFLLRINHRLLKDCGRSVIQELHGRHV